VLLIGGVVCALVAVTAGAAGVQALITSAQIQDGTIQSRDVKNGAITRADMSAGAIASLRGQRGLAGPRGAAGAQGPQGAAGAQGAQGAQGPAGPQGSQGAQGPKGDPGAGVHVTGSVATAADLPATADEGDAYIALDTGHLHVWDGDSFVDAGLVQGPKGEKGDKGDTGDQGLAGPKGDQGVQGLPGADGGLAGYEVVTGSHVAISGADFDVSASVACPAGKLAVGGGVELDAQDGGVILAESFPLAAGAGWGLTVLNFSSDPNGMTPYALCAAQA
jgi:hypothetical protein